MLQEEKLSKEDVSRGSQEGLREGASSADAWSLQVFGAAGAQGPVPLTVAFLH